MKVNVILVIILVLFQGVFVFGQKKEQSRKKISVTGTVTNKDKKPVEGAVIFIDTIFTRSMTDDDGFYRVKVSPEVKTILAVLPDRGFGQTDINPSNVVDITIQENPNRIPGFVKRGLKANIKQLAKPEKLITYQNIYEMIRQEVPGVTVSGTSITIKQGHSFFGSSTPIFVVNGNKVPSIDNIIPTQVKKIELLTGASATMYVGVEGAPGVIKITLKSGADK